MRSNSIIAAWMCGLGLSLSAGTTQAGIIGATVADAANLDYNLTSVTVSRGPAGNFTYLPSKLTGVDLTDVAAYNVPIITQNNASIPAPGTRATLLEDNQLDTGIASPVTYANPIDLAFEVTFLRPVINSIGDDVVLFSMGASTTTRFYVNNDKNQYVDVVMDANTLKPLEKSVTVRRIAYKNPLNGSTTINDLAELESPTGYFFATTLSYDIYATSFDLSSLGIPLGETVSSLRYQASGGRINSVYIAGLPAVPEPGTLALAGCAMVALLWRPSVKRR